MLIWIILIMIVAGTVAGVSLLIILRRILSPRSPNSRNFDIERTESLHNDIAKLHEVYTHHQINIENYKNPNFLFSWSDHPMLVTEAFEHGWSRFAFTTYSSSQSTRSSKRKSPLGSCGGVTHESDTEEEINWEIGPGLSDFMQKIRLNSGLNKKTNPISVVITALPLPGPQLGANSSFPQEAYFEVTILKIGEYGEGQFGNLARVRSESEKAMLIQGDSESIVHVIGGVRGNSKKFEEFKFGSVFVSIGLSTGGPHTEKTPGSYLSSIGFSSDGTIYLDGTNLVLESQKYEWAKPERVIGCGYNPSQKRVFFTIDSHLVHVINCKTDEFGIPLYPTLASNSDVTFLVNFGQSAFKYLPANSQRTPNPCFIGPVTHSPTLGYDDSREFFSMGGIDSQWLNRSTKRNSVNNYAGNNILESDFDEESEGELFDIALESSGKSPKTVLE